MRDLKIIYLTVLLSLFGMGAICGFLNVKAWLVLLSFLGSFAPIAAFFLWAGFQALELAPLLDHEFPELVLPTRREGFSDEDTAEVYRSVAYTTKILVLALGGMLFDSSHARFLGVNFMIALFGFELSFRAFLITRRRFKRLLQLAKEKQ